MVAIVFPNMLIVIIFCVHSITACDNLFLDLLLVFLDGYIDVYKHCLSHN